MVNLGNNGIGRNNGHLEDLVSDQDLNLKIGKLYEIIPDGTKVPEKAYNTGRDDSILFGHVSHSRQNYHSENIKDLARKANKIVKNTAILPVLIYELFSKL